MALCRQESSKVSQPKKMKDLNQGPVNDVASV